MNMNQIKYFLYARKSSEVDDRQVQSIDDQVRWLKEKASELGITLKKDQIFTEAKSAKKPNNRPIFTEMMARIQNGEANGILAWDISRLSRNPIDSGAIQWALQEGLIQSIQTHAREYRPEDNSLILSVESANASQFIIDLRVSTRRGIKSKLEKGWRPGLAPVGYINDKYGDKGNKKIMLDTERFDIVRKIWDLMLTGNYNPRQILDVATNQWHLTTPRLKKRGGGPLSRNGVYRLLTNIFYAGLIEYDGQTYKGSHQPMITMAEFDRVQKLLGAKGKPQPQTREFSFTGNIRCGDCGCQVTAETKTKFIKSTGELKDYTYYRCTRRKTGVVCRQMPIKLEALEPQIDAELEKFTILPVFRDWALEKLNRANDQEIIDRETVQGALHKKIEQKQRELDNLTKMRYRELIDDDEFRSEKKGLQSELAKLEQQRDHNEGRARDWLKLTEETFNFACYARRSFMFGDVRTKREIFAALGQKAILKNGELSIEPYEWFQPIIQNYAKIEAEYQNVRTKNYDSIKAKTEAVTSVSAKWGE